MKQKNPLRERRARVVLKLKNAFISVMRSIKEYYEDSDEVFGTLSKVL
jgi:hypothetical protein